jgi:hypothetical protein
MLTWLRWRLEVAASACSTHADFGRFPGVERISPLR